MSIQEETAVQKFTEGFNCAQSVFFGFAEDLGIDANTALKNSGEYASNACAKPAK